MLIKFIDTTHQYLTEDNRELISVSAFTEQFKEKVNWTAIAKKSAAKLTKQGEPTTTEQLLKKWEKKRSFSAEVGTLYHTIREQELIDSNPIFYNTSCDTKQCTYIGTDKFSIPINELSPDTVYPELMIYDTDYMICGQADKVIVTGNHIHVWDYKTDTDIKFKGWSSEYKKAKKLLGPLKHLDECNGNVYSVKMSLYMYLLWKANKGRFLPGDLIIEHINLLRDPDNDNMPVLVNGKPVVKEIKKITLPYRKKEVEDMLKTLK